MKKRLSVIVLWVFFSSCAFQGRNDSLPVKTGLSENKANKPVVSEMNSNKDEDRIIESKVISQTSAWNLRKSFVESGKNFMGASFINPEQAWIYDSDNNIFETTDGGKTWKKLPNSFSYDLKIDDIKFLDEKKGWIILNPEDNDPDNNKKVSYLYETNNGGKGWILAKKSEKMHFEHIVYNDNGQGMITGEFWENDLSFALQFNHSGNLSDKFFELPAIDKNDFIEKFLIFNDSKMVILTVSGNLFEKLDDKDSWKKIKLPELEREISFSNVGKTDGDFWFTSGRNSTEGTWSYFVSGHENQWLITELGGINLTDTVILPNRSVMAAGIGWLEEDINNGKVDFTPNAFVLYSGDKGKTWEVLYKGKNSIQKIIPLSDENIICLGTSKLILNFYK